MDSYRCHITTGDHICGIYEDEKDKEALLRDFVICGLDENDKVLCLIPDPEKDNIIFRVIREAGRDPESYVKTKQLVILSFAESYLLTGGFCPNTQIDIFRRIKREAIEQGFKNLRLTGEPTCVLLNATPQQENEIIEYESTINNFFRETGTVGMCQYNRRLLPSKVLLGILTSHPKAVIGNKSFHNFYYMPPEEYLGPNLADSTYNRWVRNLNERAALEQKLREETAEREKAEVAKMAAEIASQAKSNFLAIVSHEMRTPLNGIIPLLSSILNSPLTEEQRDTVEVIQSSSNHLLTIINDVLDFARCEHGMLKIENTPFDIRRCVNSVLKCVCAGNQVITKNIKLKCHIDEDVPDQMVGDATRVSQLLFNLLSNAYKFSFEGGEITIRVLVRKRDHVTDKPASIQFSVQDEGIGIPQNKRHIVFEAFSQVDSSMTRPQDGIGLGLAICKKIITTMNGEIWFESEVNQGTSFHFALPYIEPLPSSAYQPEAPAGLDTSDGQDQSCVAPNNHPENLRILCAEDNKINQKVIIKFLEKLGYTNVKMVENGAEAVEAVRQNDYECILMDVLMPVMDGLTASKTIKAMFENNNYPGRHCPTIIALTASALEAESNDFKTSGIDHQLTKPLKGPLLQELLQNLLKAHRHNLEVTRQTNNITNCNI